MKQEICNSNKFELHLYKTSGTPRSLFLSSHESGSRKLEMELWLTGGPENLKVPHPATLWKRQEMMAKLAPACRVYDADRRKVWETCLRLNFGRQVPERSPACADTADREEAAE